MRHRIDTAVDEQARVEELEPNHQPTHSKRQDQLELVLSTFYKLLFTASFEAVIDAVIAQAQVFTQSALGCVAILDPASGKSDQPPDTRSVQGICVRHVGRQARHGFCAQRRWQLSLPVGSCAEYLPGLLYERPCRASCFTRGGNPLPALSGGSYHARSGACRSDFAGQCETKLYGARY